MIKSKIENETYKTIGFPKLMVGVRTGAIYFAISEAGSGSGKQIRTIAISEGNFCSQKVGTLSMQPVDLLKDFNGSITLRNE